MLLKNASQEELEWLDQSHEVDESEYLEVVVLESLAKYDQVWNGTDDIKDKVARKIVEGDALDLLQSSSSLNEVQDNLKDINDVNCPLNILKSLLPRIIRVCKVLSGLGIIVLVYVMEHNYKWRHKHTIDG